MNWDVEPKNKARTIALTTKRKAVKTAMFFPSNSCLDLQEALANGLITQDTYLILVEGERGFLGQMKLDQIHRFLRKNGLSNFYIHNQKVHKLNLERVLNGRKLEYMFFDICGYFTPEIKDWFLKYRHCFANNMHLPITISTGARKGIRPYVYEKSGLTPLQVAQKAEKMLKHSKGFRYYFTVSQFYDYGTYAQLYLMSLCIAGRIVEIVKYKNSVNGAKMALINFIISNTKETKMSKTQVPVTELFPSYAAISPQHRAWITMKARAAGKNPVMVHAGIKAAFTRKKA